jgi:hypothetical protein
VRRSAAATLALGLSLACGCVTTQQAPAPPTAQAPVPPLVVTNKSPVPDKPPLGVPCQVKAVWEPQVQYQPDPGRGGAPGPVLAGRLYLFDEQLKHSMACEGSLIVDLYDLTSGQEVMLEEWRIDPVTLGRLLRRDFLGWGYTVGLPWSTFRPDVTKVVLKLRFDPAKGAPLYDTCAPMALNSGAAALTPGLMQASKKN